MSSCLIDERSIALQPTLIRIFGFERAAVLQQIHFHLQNLKSGKVIEGQKWVWNTYDDWAENDFPFWEPRTVRKWFSKLEEEGLLVSAQFDKSDWNRRKYYRIDYDAFNAKTSASKRHDDDTSDSHDDDTSKRHDGDCSCIGTKITTENTTEREKPLSVDLDNFENKCSTFDSLVLKAAKLSYVDNTLQRQLIKTTAALIQLKATEPEIVQFIESREKSVPVNFFIQRFEAWRGDKTLPAPVCKLFKCDHCQDTTSITVKTETGVRYVDCPQCQPGENQ